MDAAELNGPSGARFLQGTLTNTSPIVLGTSMLSSPQLQLCTD